jgi:hypothetical protein
MYMAAGQKRALRPREPATFAGRPFMAIFELNSILCPPNYDGGLVPDNHLGGNFCDKKYGPLVFLHQGADFLRLGGLGRTIGRGPVTIAAGHPAFEGDAFIHDQFRRRHDARLLSAQFKGHFPVCGKVRRDLPGFLIKYDFPNEFGHICTGSFILAETGLLDGRRATTNWQFLRTFQKLYPHVNLEPQQMLVQDGSMITTGAVTAAYSLIIHIVREMGSPELTSVISKVLLVDTNRPDQTPYNIFSTNTGHGDSQVLKAQQFIEKRYAEIDRGVDCLLSNIMGRPPF